MSARLPGDIAKSAAVMTTNVTIEQGTIPLPFSSPHFETPLASSFVERISLTLEQVGSKVPTAELDRLLANHS